MGLVEGDSVYFNFVIIPPPNGYAQYFGPAATLIAAIVGGWLAFRLQRLQAAIATSQIAVATAAKDVAQSQRNIAYDKLKLDAFKERYVLYVAARNLIKYLRNPGEPYINREKVAEWLEKLDESPFFFAGTAKALLDQVSTLAEEFMSIDSQRQLSQDAALSGAAAQLGRILSEMGKLYHLMPQTFEADFGFSQLTG